VAIDRWAAETATRNLQVFLSVAPGPRAGRPARHPGQAGAQSAVATSWCRSDQLDLPHLEGLADEGRRALSNGGAELGGRAMSWDDAAAYAPEDLDTGCGPLGYGSAGGGARSHSAVHWMQALSRNVPARPTRSRKQTVYGGSAGLRERGSALAGVTP
jgi:hypothetical protein